MRPVVLVYSQQMAPGSPPRLEAEFGYAHDGRGPQDQAAAYLARQASAHRDRWWWTQPALTAAGG